MIEVITIIAVLIGSRGKTVKERLKIDIMATESILIWWSLTFISVATVYIIYGINQLLLSTGKMTLVVEFGLFLTSLSFVILITWYGLDKIVNNLEKILDIKKECKKRSETK